MNMLFLDDDRASLNYYALMVKKSGLKISYSLCATSWEFGLALKNKPDLILSDINLGDTDAVEVFTKYANEVGDTPVILMSGMDSTNGVGAELRKMGINVIETMLKPISPAMLMSALV